MSTSTTPPAATGVYPCLFYRDADAAIAWLCQAFGFEARMVSRDERGHVRHSELSLGSVVIMVGGVRDELGWKSPLDLGGVTQTLCVAIADPDAHCARALAAGATVVYALADHDYGSRDYTVHDLEGNVWTFGTYVPGAYWEPAGETL